MISPLHAMHLATMTFWEGWLYAYNRQVLEIIFQLDGSAS